MKENFHKDFAITILKQTISIKYLKNCRLNKIHPANEIVGRKMIERNNNRFINKNVDSYNERCKRQDLKPQEHLLQIWDDAKKIEWPSKKFYVVSNYVFQLRFYIYIHTM